MRFCAGMTSTPATTLVTLSERPDFRVTAADTDPRGWNVLDANNNAVGSVTDLIIDVDALLARYMVCAITKGAVRHVLVPIGFAQLDAERPIVHLEFVTAAEIEKLPAFTGLPLSAAQSAQLEQALTGVDPTTPGAAKIVRRDETRDAS